MEVLVAGRGVAAHGVLGLVHDFVGQLFSGSLLEVLEREVLLAHERCVRRAYCRFLCGRGLPVRGFR